MRNPQRYKTRYGLYRATIRAMDELSTVKIAWWIPMRPLSLPA
jgi:hypothetical protein